ncbi:MAG TPA: ABC transporter ATP-binding protein, partial [Candidatus Poseidoniales archaeon]
MTMGEEILRIEDLHVSVDETPILNGMSLTINRGEIHVIMGRNG